MKFEKPLNMFKELLKRKPSKPGRFLGLCIKDMHVDLAVSDPDNLYAVPLRVHRHEGNMDLMVDKFRNLISEHDLAGFVVAYSYERCITRCEGTTIKNFISDLCKTGEFQGLKYTYWDDDIIATKHMDFVVMHHVGFILENLNLPQLQAKEIVKKFVAARILQGYLDFVNIMKEQEKDIVNIMTNILTEQEKHRSHVVPHD